MLYIKDYQSLESQVQRKQDPARKKDSAGFRRLLQSLTGKRVTVYADNGGQPFTGFLMEVSADSIRLITRPPDAPASAQNCPRCRRAVRPGTECRIMTAHITAVLYPYV